MSVEKNKFIAASGEFSPVAIDLDFTCRSPRFREVMRKLHLQPVSAVLPNAFASRVARRAVHPFVITSREITRVRSLDVENARDTIGEMARGDGLLDGDDGEVGEGKGVFVGHLGREALHDSTTRDSLMRCC